MDTKRGKQRGGVGRGVMNWEIGIDIYTLMCIKLMTNMINFSKNKHFMYSYEKIELFFVFN